MWRNPIPWKVTPETPNLGKMAETDDMRPGLGYEGLQNLQRFVKNGGVYIGAVGAAQFAIDYGMSNGVSMSTAGRGTSDGPAVAVRAGDGRDAAESARDHSAVPSVRASRCAARRRTTCWFPVC